MNSFQIIDIPQRKVMNNFKNAKQKFLKTNATIWYNQKFFLSNATTCPYGLRGLPSWAWQ
jgi:hypothetical protein